jgi:hypothetical protein
MNKLLFFVFLLWSSVIQAQDVLENNPPAIKFYQVNTPHFRVIFPKGFEAQGQRVANTLEFIHDEEAKSLGSLPRKISVILQNQSAIANGFVSAFPRRSEFYGMPPQDYNYLGNTDWLDLLASHEYRHIVQYQHAFRGFNKAFYYMFGATAFAGMAQAAAPMWFWEGDAVATETAFTATGRGRIPNFSLVFKTNLLERKRIFNYHKQYLRSYKHNIPDHYVLGYHMVSYLRERSNDPEIWGKITKRTWSVPFIPFRFSSSIKKETGLHVTELYREMAQSLKTKWLADLDKLELTPFERISSRKTKFYTDFNYPQAMDDGSVVVMKSGIGEIQTFTRLKDGEEKKIFIPGIVNDAGMLSLGGNSLVWTEYGYDPRFLVKNFSLIKTVSIENGKREIVSPRQSRYTSAAISPDGKKIAAIETTTEYQTTLVVINAETGAVETVLKNPENYFYSMPRWSPDGSQIVMLKTKGGKKSIVLVDASLLSVTDVTDPSDENIGHPVLAGDYILYNSPITGIDNIFAVKISTKEKLQVTSSRYGAYNPSVPPNGKYIYYNDQSKLGLDVVRIPFDPSSWFPINSQQLGPTYAQTLIEQEAHPNFLQNVPMQSLPVKKYSKFRGLVNPYAWGLNVETDLTAASVGILSKDLLSTTALSLGYNYDINERTGTWRAALSYQGLFPILDLSVSKSNRKVDEGLYPFERRVGGDTVVFQRDLTFEWKETSIQGGIRIPLLLTRSKYYSEINVANNVGYTQINDFKNSITNGGRILPYTLGDSVIFRDYADDGSLVYNHVSLTADHLLKQSRRDINSRWGQRLNLNLYNTPFGGDFSGFQFSGYATLYFPGIAKHHSIWGYGAYQYTELSNARNEQGKLDNYIFRNRIPTPRGDFSFPRLEHFYTASVNYTLPIWSPDFAIGPVLHLQRFRANGFFDYGYITSDIIDFRNDYASIGAELKLDLNIMRFYPQFDIGIRFSQDLKSYTHKFELLIGTFNF